MSFLVVAAGHSGTKFLATQLNKSPVWTVEHEPDPYMFPHLVNHRFDRSLYGEVNSWLLSSCDRIDVDNLAALLRNPYEILASLLTSSQFCEYGAIMYVREAISILDRIASTRLVIRFNQITTDKDEIVKAGRLLGIYDLPEDQLSLEKINQHTHESNPYVASIDLNRVVKDEFDYFVERWSL